MYTYIYIYAHSYLYYQYGTIPKAATSMVFWDLIPCCHCTWRLWGSFLYWYVYGSTFRKFHG